MNNDLISREALKKAISEHCRSETECLNHFWYDENIISLIDNAPTVDLVSPTIKVNISEETTQKLIEELQKPHKLLVWPEPEIEFERTQGEPVIKCQDCKYQIKEFRSDKREKDGGHYVYACKRFGEMFGYWGWGGEDNEFCSDAEQTGGAE